MAHQLLLVAFSEGFCDDMNLSANDLEDTFVDDLCAFLAIGSTRLHRLILNKDGLTPDGACKLAMLLGRAQTWIVEGVDLQNNPNDSVEAVLQSARESGSGMDFMSAQLGMSQMV